MHLIKILSGNVDIPVIHMFISLIFSLSECCITVLYLYWGGTGEILITYI